jgi:Group II intron, maturase-specific domain
VSGAAGRSAEVLRARGGVGIEVGTAAHVWQSHIHIYKDACRLAQAKGLPSLIYHEPVLEVRFVRGAAGPTSFLTKRAQRVMKSIKKFITQKLKLKVNATKSAVARPQDRKFLGFSFTDGPEIKRVIAPKSLARFKRRVREITRRAKGVSIDATMEELAPYMRGWRSYFGFCENPRGLASLTSWVRARLRVALWRQ